MPPGGRKRRYQDGGVELYDDGRFLTVTGHALPTGRRTLVDQQVAIEAVHARIFGPSEITLAAIPTFRTVLRDLLLPPAPLIPERSPRNSPRLRLRALPGPSVLRAPAARRPARLHRPPGTRQPFGPMQSQRRLDVRP